MVLDGYVRDDYGLSYFEIHYYNENGREGEYDEYLIAYLRNELCDGYEGIEDFFADHGNVYYPKLSDYKTSNKVAFPTVEELLAKGRKK